MLRALYISVALALFLSPSTLQAQPQKTDPELLRLRQEYSQRFLEPGPHMQLAKYFREKGNLIQAFYILEAARRYRFDQETFDAAFLLHFGGFAPLDNSPAAEARYIELRKASPNDLKLLRHLADIYISRSDYKRGESLLLSAYEKDPADYRTLVALGEIYRRLGTPEKAIRLVNLFLEKYSDSVGGYYFRLQSESDSPAAKALLADAITKYPGEGY